MGRKSRIGVALVAIAALMGLLVLPAAHIHHLLSGESFVHQHLDVDIATERHADDELAPHVEADDHDHDTHATAIGVAYTVERTAILMALPVLLSRQLVLPPDTRSIRLSGALDAPIIHGPPRSGLSLRAPPA